MELIRGLVSILGKGPRENSIFTKINYRNNTIPSIIIISITKF